MNLKNLIDAATPLWAGEAEVVRTYWSSPKRNLETDLLWLRRQCFKEFCEQLRQRIRMRNAQFNYALSEERVQAIYRGDIKPLAFDYERAGVPA